MCSRLPDRCSSQGIGDYDLRNYPLTAAARANPRLNPGNDTVSRLCHEPRVGLAALEELLAPHVASGRLVIMLRHRAIDSDAPRDRVEAVRVRSLATGADTVLRAPLFVDVTELGDLLPLTRTEFVTGSESTTSFPPARTSGPPTSPTAPIACTRSSGTSARRRRSWRCSAWTASSRRRRWSRTRRASDDCSAGWSGPACRWRGSLRETEGARPAVRDLLVRSSGHSVLSTLAGSTAVARRAGT